MDYSMDAVANKVIMVIAGLSFLIAVGGYIFYMMRADAAYAFPFAAGVAMAMGVNIAKVLLMKNAVNNAVKREAVAAKLYLQGQYFLRLTITGVVLFIAGWLHANMVTDAGRPQYVNFMGAFFGIFTFPIAMYSMRFFLRDELKDAEILPSSDTGSSSIQDAINELNAIGAEENDNNKAG